MESGIPGGARRPARREVVSWCLFDFANSSFTTLIVTVAFAVYFREAVVNRPGNVGDQIWGRATFLAMMIVALTSPILGALADGSGKKKLFLVLTSLQTIVATALLYLVGPGDVTLGVVLFVIGLVGFEAGYVFYNAFLPEVSTPATIGRVSGWAWAVGYVGGLSALALCYPLIGGDLKDPSGALQPDTVQGYQWSFLLVAGFYLVFAVPAFLFLRESAGTAAVRQPLEIVTLGFRRVRDTLGHLRKYREVSKFIVASLLFNDGITTVIAFSAIYATVTFGFTGGQVVILFLILNIVAAPGSVVAGHLADRIGAKRTLVLTLILWIGVVIVGATARNTAMFYVMACGAALGMGSTQAVGRSFMAQISPPEREAEFFGFYVLSGKFASMFGPLIFGEISNWTGSQRWAVISLLPFFLAGLLILSLVRDEVARRVAAGGNHPG